MNVIFHTTAAIGVSVLLTDTGAIGDKPTLSKVGAIGLLAFGIGVISHGALDFIPHCYPINSKLDVIGGLAMILLTTWFTNKPYRLIMGLGFLGSIFPDLIDLGPKILNTHLDLRLTLPENIFPWHWHEYSGSIYNDRCNVSWLNHSLVVISVFVSCWARRRDLKEIFLGI